MDPESFRICPKINFKVNVENMQHSPILKG